MSVKFSDTLTTVSALQFRKASRSSLVTLFGMLIEVRPQSAKAPCPMVVMTASAANSAVFSFEHPAKAFFSMVDTVFGNTIFSNSISP